MILIAQRSHNKKAEGAEYLLEKYAKNSAFGKAVAVSFIEDTNCVGDEYRIEVKENEILVFGNTPVAFNAAVGYLVRHQHTGIESKTVTFNSEFRASYFANHFYNYYHAAPVEEICEYIESLSLWGQTALCLWFDMHHFTSLTCREANEMIEKMIKLFGKARSLGMKTVLMHLGNEYFSGAPEELLAQNSLESGKYTSKLCGYYYTELCPSIAEGEKLLLSSFDELLSRFDSVGIDHIMLWPYDQGGCTCDACFPWGGGGFYRVAKRKAEIAKQHFPNINVIFSCWRFDTFTTGEWDAALSLIEKDGDWIDRLMVDIHAQLPETLPFIGKPIVSFPEISMYHATPWGGFGANPFPMALGAQFRNTKAFCHGGALYSEGIFEDINKAVSLELMRDPDTSPEQTVLEYCVYHFGAEYAKSITDLIMRSEQTLHRRTYLRSGERCDYPSGSPKGLHTYTIVDPAPIEALAKDCQALHDTLPDSVKESWRYQIIYARLMGDLALHKNNGVPSEESDEILSKLIGIFHAENAYYFVAPVTRESVMKNRGEGV